MIILIVSAIILFVIILWYIKKDIDSEIYKNDT